MKRTILLTVIIALLSVLNAFEVQIGELETANTQYMSPTPYGNYYRNERVQYLYTADEINEAGGGEGNIVSLAFNVANAYSVQPRTFRLKIGTYTPDLFESNSFATGLNEVFFSEAYQPVHGWNIHAFDVPFYWDGQSNLVVEAHFGDISLVSSGNTGVYYGTANNRAIYNRSDNQDLSGISTGSRSANRADILFDMAEFIPSQAPNPALLVSPADAADMQNYLITLKWRSGGGAPQGYKLFFGNSPQPEYYADLGNSRSWDTYTLEAGSTYYWKVVPYNSAGEAENCPVWSFSTLDEGVIIIGEGTGVARQPLGNYFGYERSAILYRASEIGAQNSRIRGLGWYATLNLNSSVPTRIYLKNYGANTLTNSTWAEMISGANLVYDHAHPGLQANEWNTFNLDEYYDLPQGSNLLVLIERNTGNYGSGTSGGAGIRYTQTPGTHLSWNQNASAPTGTGNSTNNRPNIVLYTQSYEILQPPHAATLISPTHNAMMVNVDISLNWSSGGASIAGYKLYFGQSPQPDFVADLGMQSSWTPQNLDYDSRYYWQIVPYNAAGDAADCPVWSFQTVADNLILLGNDVATMSAPFATLRSAARTQMLYTADELIAAGATVNESIRGIGFHLSSFSNLPIHNLLIRLKETEASELSAFENEASLFQNCYLHTFAFDNSGWNYFYFDQPFIFDGSKNILIDISFTNENWLASSYVYCSQNFGKTWIQQTGSGIGADLDGGEAYPNRPNTRFYFENPPLCAPGTPILVSPSNGAHGMPIQGFELSWRKDYAQGIPSYYTVFMSMEESTLWDDYFFETTAPTFNPVNDGDLSFDYDQRWYWAVEAVNEHGSSISETFRFDITPSPAQISISYSPFQAQLEIGESSRQALEISNTGGLPLQYSIRFENSSPLERDYHVFKEAIPHAFEPENNDLAPQVSTELPSGNRAQLDVQMHFPTQINDGEYGVVTDGEYIYTGKWNSPGGVFTVHKYDLEGNYLQDIAVSGAGSIRDLTYDGQYFYGVALGNTIYQMDFEAGITVRSISTSMHTLRGIAYDPNHDAFWVNNRWEAPFMLIDRQGNILQTVQSPAHSIAGIAYDHYSDEPCLWANTFQGFFSDTILQIRLSDGSILQSFPLNSTILPGLWTEDPAGGIDTSTRLFPGTASLLGCTQNSMIYAMELCEIPLWIDAEPRLGYIVAESSQTVDIIFNGDSNFAGQYSANIIIHHNADSESISIPATLDLSGQWLPQADISPNAWDFGEQELLNETPKTFSVYNSGAPGLNILYQSIYLENDAEGNFQLNTPNLPVSIDHNGYYRFEISFVPQSVGYKTANLIWQDEVGNHLHNIPLSGYGIPETIGTVIGLQADVQGIYNVALSWGISSGEAGEPAWLHYDNGNGYEGIGTGQAGSFDVAIKFSSADLLPYLGMQIQRIKLLPFSLNTDYTLKIWTGQDNSISPAYQAYSQPLDSFNAYQWNRIQLNTPFELVAGQAIWIGYTCTVYEGADMFPAACDSGPAVSGRGDLICLNGVSWNSLSLDYAMDNNWNLQAFVNYPEHAAAFASLPQPLPLAINAENTGEITLSKSGHPLPAERALIGFNIFRNAVQLNSEPLSSRTYLDYSLLSGSYEYTVQAVYHSENSPLSDAVVVDIVAPEPIALPFCEDWSSGSFDTNHWSIANNNWQISFNHGNPGNSAMFNGNPNVMNYIIPLSSYYFDATGMDSVLLSFDFYLDIFSHYSESMLIWQVWDGEAWNTINGYSSSHGGVTWSYVAQDISAYAANRLFKIRFLAVGEDSNDIYGWYIDNICLNEMPAQIDPISDISISMEYEHIRLDFEDVPGAQWYLIYVATDINGPYQEIGYTPEAGTLYIPLASLPAKKAFFRVTAGAGPFPDRYNHPRNLKD